MPFDKHAKFAFIVACLLLLGSSLGLKYAVRALDAYLRKLPVEMRESFTLIPSALGRWQAVTKDELLPVEMVEELGTDKYLNRAYAIDGQPGQGLLSVHLAYYTGMIDAVPHVADRCLIAGGYELRTPPANYALALDRSRWTTDEALKTRSDEPYPILRYRDENSYVDHEVIMPIGDMEIRVTEFQDTEKPELRIFGGYFFIANGRVTAMPEGVRLMAFNLSEKYAYYCKVQFIYGARGATVEQFLAHVADMLNPLLPEVMECLPDWPEVERRDAGAAPAGVVSMSMTREVEQVK